MSATNVQNERVHRSGISQTLPRAQRILDQQTLSVEFPIQTHRAIGHGHSREDPARCIDKVFNVYGERLRSDLRDMHGLCTQLVAQEKQETARWYALCAKVMMERDHARRRVRVLSNERHNFASTSSSAEAQNIDFSASRGGRKALASTLDVSSAKPTTSPAEKRPMRALCLSPVHSPPSSPSPAPSISSPMSTIASPPFDATTLPSSSCPKLSPFEERPVKRRRSCDVSHLVPSEINFKEPSSSSSTPFPPNFKIKQQSRSPSPLTPPEDLLASNFSHVDLMYVSARGAFVCRACLLEKFNAHSFPKAFPLTASWDELRDHCVGMHPKACADVARLQPAEIFELRRRLSLC